MASVAIRQSGAVSIVSILEAYRRLNKRCSRCLAKRKPPIDIRLLKLPTHSMRAIIMVGFLFMGLYKTNHAFRLTPLRG